MSDMIEAKDAKKLLGCDDAALNNHINSGAVRAQRTGGKLLLNKADVEKLAKDGKDDDGTIVLTGDSDDLSIDLGKVVDDSAETIVQNNKAATDSASGTESITFGEELEVVNFDDHHTSELVFDETKQTGQVQNLSFTDSNTAVMTAVDETSVGATTAPIDFQTQSSVQAPSSQERGAASSSRRSARSQRVEPEEVKVHWIWPTLLIVTTLFMGFLALPYYILAMHPRDAGEKDAAKNTARGLDDKAWTNIASKIAGFTVEPNKKKFEATGGDEFIELKDTKDPSAIWRFNKYLNGKATADDRQKDFVVTSVSGEPGMEKAKTSEGSPELNVITREVPVAGEVKAATREVDTVPLYAPAAK